MKIRVFGIHRVGTNYISELFFNNVVIPPETINVPAPEWKHGPVENPAAVRDSLRIEANNKAIVIIKNPYTWYTSITNFLEKNARSGVFDNWNVEMTLEEMFDVYNDLYSNHRDFLLSDGVGTYYSDSVLVRYEDLIENPLEELKKIADVFELALTPKFNNMARVPMSSRFTEDNRRYYINQEPIYGEKTIARVTDAVDWELMGFYGYDKIKVQEN